MGPIMIIFIFAVCMVYQVFAVVAQAKNDPVESEVTCLREVSKKYDIPEAAVKVVYRGDDSAGNHIVNYVLGAHGPEDLTGICLVKLADSTVQIKELDVFPNDDSR